MPLGVAFHKKTIQRLPYPVCFCRVHMEQLALFNEDGSIALEEVFAAYYDCRKHKRKTLNALAFELDYEQNLIDLWRDINAHAYQVGRSISFIVNRPVKREIFAADFRDRVVHHLIIRKLNDFFEASFSPDSYSCRKGKGTLYAINQVYAFIKRCSLNYTRGCYVMKLDIEGFFMNIRPRILHRLLIEFVNRHYINPDKAIVMELIEKVVMNRPEKNCVRKGRLSDWDGLPASKSLFASNGFGLPIGNLTSQIFANFYLNEFDYFVKRLDGDLCYGRYVDDLIFVHPDKDFLLKIKPVVTCFLKEKYGLNIHPKKLYLQPIDKGVAFVGGFLLPQRVYASKRLKRHFFERIHFFNANVQVMNGTSVPGGRPERLEEVLPVFNSYLGLMKHFNSRRLRQKAVNMLNLPFKKCVTYDSAFLKVSPHNKFNPICCRRAHLARERCFILNKN